MSYTAVPLWILCLKAMDLAVRSDRGPYVRFGSWACLNVLTYEPELGETATQAGFLTLTMPGSQPSAAGCP
jgi:hypothetical protein